jgi:REP element-mobilizing transposase RayT
MVETSRIRSRGHLPHWESPNGVYFVTFRLANSLPKSVLLRIKAQDAKETQSSASSTLDQRFSFVRHRKGGLARAIEESLDRGDGVCHLATPELAQCVAKAMKHFEGVRYKLFAWCVMPNHLHAVLQPVGKHDLAGIMHSWKSFTARISQRRFGLRGRIWQREYYDRLIRDERQFWRAVRYVFENPRRAGLENWPWVGFSAPS